MRADSEVIAQARIAAKQQGTTLNQAFRNWLVEYTRSATVEASIDDLYRRLQHVNPGRKFSREEMNER
ncbi:MAG TPA: hypothetical protein VNH18_22100 [Bryobacteraceae bacterium]|nr:hypothetical protein [Bryobacteraceae bacterium]